MQRDNWRCRQCRNGATVKNPLEVHHVDGNAKNMDESNLITLCSDCHKAQHRG